MVEQWWAGRSPQGCGAFFLAKKLVGLRDHLRQWAKFSFGSIKLKKLNILHELEDLDLIKEHRRLSSLENGSGGGSPSEIE